MEQIRGLVVADVVQRLRWAARGGIAEHQLRSLTGGPKTAVVKIHELGAWPAQLDSGGGTRSAARTMLLATSSMYVHSGRIWPLLKNCIGRLARMFS